MKKQFSISSVDGRSTVHVRSADGGAVLTYDQAVSEVAAARSQGHEVIAVVEARDCLDSLCKRLRAAGAVVHWVHPKRM